MDVGQECPSTRESTAIPVATATCVAKPKGTAMKSNRTAQPDKLTKSEKARLTAPLALENEGLTFKSVCVIIVLVLVAAWAAGEYIIHQMHTL